MTYYGSAFQVQGTIPIAKPIQIRNGICKEEKQMMNKRRFLLSLVLMLVMIVPAGFITAGDSDTAEDQIPVQDEERGEVIGKSDNVRVERVDDEEMKKTLGDFDYRRDARSGLRADEIHVQSDRLSTSDRIDRDIMSVGNDVDVPVPEGIGRNDAVSKAEITRATDDDPANDDLVNGSSVVTPSETIDGSLEYVNTGTSDGIDWYQLEVDNDPSPGGTIHNVSFNLDSYTGDDLEEYQLVYDEQGDPVDLNNTYGDFMTLYVAYFDPFLGFTFIGGTDFFYDDQDDTDGWIWDGDHPEYPDANNYTFNFETPIESEGTNDANGLANGLTETGFYYMGLTFSWYVSQDAPATRLGFTADYTITIDASSTENADQASSDWKNATAPYTESTFRMDSRFNHVDWYMIEGTNQNMLWNMSFNFNWTNLNRANYDAQFLYDPWTYVYFIWKWEGEDDEWDTDDDGFFAYRYHFSWFGIGSQSNPAISPDPDAASPFPTSFQPWIQKRDIDSPHREVYLGLVQEPQTFGYTQSGGNLQITGQYYPGWYSWAEMDFQVQIGEYTPNDPPQISNVSIKTDNPKDRELFPLGGGYYDTEFTIEVTYMDENNDPPQEVLLTLDPDTPYEKTIDVTDPNVGGGPKDAFDSDFTDAGPTPGKVYQFSIMGEDLTDTPDPHQIRVNATDFKPTGNIRLPKLSEQFYLNDTLRVWDDEPVIINPNYEPLPPLYEDDPVTELTLENVNGDGLFEDPEGEFEGFHVWNKTSEEWDETYDGDIFHISVGQNDLNTWVAFIKPKHNEHGTESVRFRGMDEHSEINATATIQIQAVNDPPMVQHILIGSSEVEPTNEDQLRPVINIMDRDDVLEDEEFVFTIEAQDTDKEEDRGDLSYSYIPAQSDQWSGDIDVDIDTGEVRFTPTNEDVKGKEKMMFSIDDGGQDGEIRLEVRLDVTNTNDPPEITQLQMPGSSSTNFEQFDKINIQVRASDVDTLSIGNEESLTYSVNMESSIDGNDAVLDQLSADADLQKGGAWDMDASTGAFWFQIDDQNIWKTANGMVDEVEINLAFQVTDAAGDTDTRTMILTLKNVNEQPPKPGDITYTIQDEDPDTNGAQGLTVDFSVEEVEDPDGDELTYHWNFGDGTTATGTEVTHTFPSAGNQQVTVYVSDGEYDTDKSFAQFTLEEVETGGDDTEPSDDDDDTTPVGGEDDGNTMLYVIIGIGVLILIIVVVVLAFFALRKKPQPAQQQYAGYDQQALGGYEAQGLPPGQEGQQLPGAQQQGLPPGEGGEPESLPPAQGGEMPQQGTPEGQTPQPEAQPEMAGAQAQQEAPQAQPETQQQPEGEGGMTCPSCGSPVDSSWFLCPNCKAPLQ